MNYDQLHKYSTGESQIIALIDSGISDFQVSKINKSYSFVKDVNDFDTNGHGTMMCSLILGSYDKVGISPNVKINSYKVVNNNGKIEPQVLADAINKAVQDKVNIINVSLGSYFDNELVKNAVTNANNQDILVIASSGDYETADMLFPAKYNNCISVGAINKNLESWESTNASKECTILAPGVDIKTLDVKKEYSYTSGTSQSTALISGYISLLKDYAMKKNIVLSNQSIRDILQKINKGDLSYCNAFENLK